MSKTVSVQYDDDIVRKFLLVTILWGVVALLAGVLIAAQLIFRELNFAQWFAFGRLRPLHTNAAIFAFVGNAMFAGVYHSTQRLCKARLFNDFLSRFHFYGWQLIIVAAAITLPLGYTTSKEYAELEWPVDLAIAVVWIGFAINFFGTLYKRREKHLYVAIWFYIATVLTVALLHVFNSLNLPVSFLKSYPVYAGVQDALVQWWYGHNAVAFFLTTPILGLMYYYLPKAANRPVYSYRLSVIHFWALVFIYIWAGPHHLLYSSVPEWAQSLGMVFSLMLIAPSWGGMLNGLLTLRGAWNKVKEDPILKFLVTAITFYGMSTFEGPMLSIKSVNSLSHFTDWTIGHVHSGALGWNGLMNFALLYFLIPKLWKTKLHSVAMANFHFWTATIGIIFYIVSMWIAGITQGLMWRAFDGDGYLVYGNFLETVLNVIPMYYVRLLGGVLYLTGTLVMVFNLWKTIANAGAVEDEVVQVVEVSEEKKEESHGSFSSWIEHHALQLSALAFVAVLVGSVIEFVPAFVIKSNIPTISSVKPYTPLELEGRDLYIREGCNNCHSQMVRPFRAETERYGEYSKPGEFVYDHPHLWGSKRTGPDLHRIGGKYPDIWHYRHMEEPRSTSPGSIMPKYPWLISQELDTSLTKGKMKAMKALGVPYSNYEIDNGVKSLERQARQISRQLEAQGVENVEDKEIVAMIAYLQRLGTDIKNKTVASKE